jgi:hypothetical protein
MEQKELEKIAEKLYPINASGGSMEMLSRHQLDNSLRQEGFIDGVKLMAKTMFSEADMREAIVKASLSNIDDLIERCDDILRQFNKK